MQHNAKQERLSSMNVFDMDKISLEDVDVATEQLTGSILKRRYLIGRELDRGSFGRVFKVIDL